MLLANQNVGGWYWLAMGTFAAGAAMGCRYSLVTAGGLAVVQAVRLLVRNAEPASLLVPLMILAVLVLGRLPMLAWTGWMVMGVSMLLVLAECWRLAAPRPAVEVLPADGHLHEPC